jgi:peptidoglycan/LPS O-acetylase OafA/YrhL
MLGRRTHESPESAFARGRIATMKYAPQLDGLRAIAILAVLVFHALPGTLRGGFTGVDVFFVLSGYLITSVILYDMRAGQFSLREFYLRRVQRLLPNAVAMVLAVVALSQVAMLPSGAVKVAGNGLWAIFELSNFFIWRNIGGYWSDSAAGMPLLHTWSLAVEEQFYIVFPILLGILLRRSRPLAATICLLIASLTLSVYGSWRHPLVSFYMLPGRAWEILLGAVFALALVPARDDRPERRWRPGFATELAGVCGLLLIGGGFWFIREARGFPGAVALVPTVGALAVLVATVDGTSRTAWLLSRPPLVLIGRLSYSLYLWHWPLITIGRRYANLTGGSEQAGALMGACAGVGLSAIAYRVIERPLRQRGPGRGRRLATLTTMFCVCAGVCLALSLRHPTADTLRLFDPLTYHGQQYNVGQIFGRPGAAPAVKLADVLSAPAAPHAAQAWNTGGIVNRWGGGYPRVVVLGSSHALMYARMIDEVCKQLGLSVAFLAADGSSAFSPEILSSASECFPSPGLARSFDTARWRWVHEWKPDVVIVADRWDSYAREPAAFERMLRELVGGLNGYARHVILFSQPPVLRVGEALNLRELVNWRYRALGAYPSIAPDANEPFRRSTIGTFAALAKDYPTLRVLRADAPFYLKDGTVRYCFGRSFFYVDDDHLSDDGSEQLHEACADALAAATGIERRPGVTRRR